MAGNIAEEMGRRKIVARLAVLILIIAVIASQAVAVDLRSGRSILVSKGDAVEDDMLAGGSNINLEGSIAGNALVAGETVSITGPVEGFLGLAGQNVNVRGTKQMIAAAGQNVNVQSASARNAVMAGNNVDVDTASNVARDVIVAGNNVTLRGTIGRDVRAAGNNLNIGGNIGGNVFASGANITVLPGTAIRGNLIYESQNKASIGEGAQIKGRVEQLPPRKGTAMPRGPGRAARAVFGFLTMFVFGAVMVALFPRWSAETARGIITLPGRSALIGIIALIVVPIAAIIAFITLIGIPIGFTLLFVYIIAWLAAIVVAALAVGALILRGQSIWLQLLLGLAALYIAGSIPLLGGLLRFAIPILGFGAIALTFFQRRAQAV